MAMSLQDLLAAIAGGQGMSPISQGFSPATRMPQGRGRRKGGPLGPKIMNPDPRPPYKPPLRPLPGRPDSGPSQARPLPSIKPRPGRPAPAQDGMRPMPLIIDRDDPNMPSQFMEQLEKPRGSFAGERVQPQLPQPMMQPAAAPPRMNEQELMEMLFAAYQDRNMSGRNRGARGFRGRPVTGI